MKDFSKTPPTSNNLEELARERILIMDGAMGTMIQQEKLQEEDFRGDHFKNHSTELKGNNDLLCLTRPEIIRNIHRAYFDAGSDMVETNTFNATSIAMADYGLEEIVPELNLAAAKIAREAADEAMAKDPSRPRFVAGAIGPTNRTASLSPDVNDPSLRNVNFDQLVEAYFAQTKALVEGGVDLLLPETTFDTLNLKAAIFAIENYFESLGRRIPVIMSITITDASGRTLSGQTTEACWNSIAHAKPMGVGLNSHWERMPCVLTFRLCQKMPIASFTAIRTPVYPTPCRLPVTTKNRRTPLLSLRFRGRRVAQFGRRLLWDHARTHPCDFREAFPIRTEKNARDRPSSAIKRPGTF